MLISLKNAVKKYGGGGRILSADGRLRRDVEGRYD